MKVNTSIGHKGSVSGMMIDVETLSFFTRLSFRRRHSLIFITILSFHASSDLNSGKKKHTYLLMICFRTGSNSFFVCFPPPYQLYSNLSWPSPNSSGNSLLVKLTAKFPEFLDSRKVFLEIWGRWPSFSARQRS